MKDVEKTYGLGKDKNRLIRVFPVVGVLVSVGFHLPFCWQFDIVPCDGSNRNQTGCWTHVKSYASSTLAWQFYGYVYQIFIKVTPMVTIFVLNVCIAIKFRAVMLRRRELRQRSTEIKMKKLKFLGHDAIRRFYLRCGC